MALRRQPAARSVGCSRPASTLAIGHADFDFALLSRLGGHKASAAGRHPGRAAKAAEFGCSATCYRLPQQPFVNGCPTCCRLPDQQLVNGSTACCRLPEQQLVNGLPHLLQTA